MQTSRISTTDPVSRDTRSAAGRAIRRAITYCLDTIAPPDPLVREIENMRPEEFYEKASARANQDGTDSQSGANDIQAHRDGARAGVIALLPYRNKFARTALVEIKTVRNITLVQIIARAVYPHLIARAVHPHMMARPKAETGEIEGACILAVIPMTKRALRARGWNQCELLAREMCAIDAGTDSTDVANAGERQRYFEPCLDALIKIRETGDQVGKGRAERMKNISSCMAANPRRDVAGRTVIVLDDIVTTGATLEEARRALLQAGARAVICVAVAF